MMSSPHRSPIRRPFRSGPLLLAAVVFGTAASLPAQAPGRSIFDRASPEVCAAAEAGALRLWPDAAPSATGTGETDTPKLYPVLPVAGGSAPRPVIIVLAGGSYTFHSAAEAFPIAERFRDAGFAAFVLSYRLRPYPVSVSLLDAQRAVRLLRSVSASLNLDDAHIAAIGFSAGGHLAANLSTHGDDGRADAADPVERFSCRLQSAVLVYPAILHQRVSRDTPEQRDLGQLLALDGLHRAVDARTAPTYLAVGYDDDKTPYEHTLAYAAALHRAGVRFELHVFGEGSHGGSVRENPRLPWQAMALNWLRLCGFGAGQ